MHDRSSRGETYWRSALQHQSRSGLSIARFCDQEPPEQGVVEHEKDVLVGEVLGPT
jgi:hypothetical protein